MFVVLRLAPSRANTGLKLFHEMDVVFHLKDEKELYLYCAVEQNVFSFVLYD